MVLFETNQIEKLIVAILFNKEINGKDKEIRSQPTWPKEPKIAIDYQKYKSKPKFSKKTC